MFFVFDKWAWTLDGNGTQAGYLSAWYMEYVIWSTSFHSCVQGWIWSSFLLELAVMSVGAWESVRPRRGLKQSVHFQGVHSLPGAFHKMQRYKDHRLHKKNFRFAWVKFSSSPWGRWILNNIGLFLDDYLIGGLFLSPDCHLRWGNLGQQAWFSRTIVDNRGMGMG